MTTASPLRILHVVVSDRFAGVEQFIRRLSMLQADDGHTVTVIGGAAAHMSASLAAAGVTWRPAGSRAAAAAAVRRLVPDVDVVNTHMTEADLVALAARLASRGDAAIVSTRHFAQRRGSTGPGAVYRALERALDGEISISHAVAAAIGVPSTVIHPGVEPTDEVGVRQPVALVAQRLQPEKHTDVAVRAFAASGIADEGWTLDIAGAGPEHDSLKRLAAALGVADSVRLLGFRDDLPVLMTRAGVLIASAPYEHFGLTVLEAMAAGLPVVAADAAGHAEMLSGLDPRALFPPDDVEAAASRLKDLAADSAARDALGRAEQTRQREAFSLRSQADATEEVYRHAIDRRAKR